MLTPVPFAESWYNRAILKMDPKEAVSYLKNMLNYMYPRRDFLLFSLNPDSDITGAL